MSINFDDGYESAYVNGLPILDHAGLKSTQFIITHLLDRSDFVTTQQVLAMQANGHEIGAHTRTHPHLNTLDEDDQRDQILGSFDDLVALGIHPAFFAYPFGDRNDTSVSIAGSTFVGARTVTSGFVSKTGDPMLMPCFSISPLPYHLIAIGDIENVIDQAQSTGAWAILLFHRVDEDSAGDSISVPHELIQEVVDYLVLKKTRVVTMSEGWQLLNAQP